jgi:hypothetical protein
VSLRATCEVIRVNAQRSVAVGLRDGTGATVDMGNVTVSPNEALGRKFFGSSARCAALNPVALQARR